MLSYYGKPETVAYFIFVHTHMIGGVTCKKDASIAHVCTFGVYSNYLTVHFIGYFDSDLR